jgi:hypothetical protein
VSSLHPCLASIAILNRCKSQKPTPPPPSFLARSISPTPTNVSYSSCYFGSTTTDLSSSSTHRTNPSLDQNRTLHMLVLLVPLPLLRFPCLPWTTTFLTNLGYEATPFFLCLEKLSFLIYQSTLAAPNIIYFFLLP